MRRHFSALASATVTAAVCSALLGSGNAAVAGTLSASTLLGTLDTGTTFLTTPVFGEVSLLIGAVLLVRAMPQGITGSLFKGST